MSTSPAHPRRHAWRARRSRGPVALLLVPLLVALGLSAARAADTTADTQDPVAVVARLVTPHLVEDELRDVIELLSSDLLEGREAGRRGEQRAAAFLISRLSAHEALRPGGTDGDWLQPFEIRHGGELRLARNVIAILPGSDPLLAGQAIVFGAHYDHVGFGHSGNSLGEPGEIHNGADDNASGSAAVLELAAAVASSEWRPRRTWIFQWYSGEELGLLGSRHWVAQPTWPLEQVVAMFNMDMVGRLTGRTLLVGGVGTSPDFAELPVVLGSALGLKVIADAPGSAPSDNSSFYARDIPALFLFTGLHADYHRPGDDAERVNVPGVRDIARLALKLGASVDARTERPPFTRAPGAAYLFAPRAWLGAAFVQAAPGLPGTLVADVLIPDGPAARAGLRKGDLLSTLNGTPLTDAARLQSLLDISGRDVEPLQLTVLREAPAQDPSVSGATVLRLREWESLDFELLPEVR